MIYGKKIETEEFEGLEELINEVHYLLQYRLGKERVSAIHVSVT